VGEPQDANLARAAVSPDPRPARPGPIPVADTGATNAMKGDDAAMANIAELADLLRESEEHHGAYEVSAAAHHWSDWYAAYVSARQDGYSPDEAARDAGIYVASLPTEPSDPDGH
jgi:hypothetical protein